MASRLVDTQGTEEVYYCSRVGAVIGLMISGVFIVLGATVMEDAGFFRWPWLGFSSLVAAACLRGLLKRYEFARVGLDGVRFTAAKLPLIPWERIVGIELGPRSEPRPRGRTVTTESKRPILLLLADAAEDLRRSKSAFAFGMFSGPDAQGRVQVRIDGSFCPIETAKFVERLRFFRGDAGVDADFAKVTAAKAEASKGASLGAVIFVTIWAAGFAGLGGMFAVGTAGQMLEGARARGWPEAQGSVLSSTVVTHTGKKGRKTYRAEVAYDYAIDRRRYTGNRVDVSDVTSAKEEAQAVAAEYSVGAPVRVRFNPEEPSKSVLRPGVPGELWVPLGIGTLFAVVGLVVAGAVYRSYFKARKAARA